MNDRDRLRVLRATREFAGLGDAKLRSLFPYIDELCVDAGTRVAEEGRLCHQFVIVVSGMLETCRRGRSGRIGPGESFGWEAMRARGCNDETVLATSPASLLVMGHAQFRAAEGLATPR
ncbi:MAG: cyclic nucleotide-binding domain-containing protein [Chloroflexi bacterium]|nr:MAG: cyclic nucleotide-binding domain-containing protein [Chloroflexota bacterium]TMG29685.1 MAG: cyclic nucleotide-binding domain-containing protein [Chloroflexota bacterium]